MKRLSKRTGIILYVVNIVLIIALVISNFYAMAYKQIISIYFGHETNKVVSSDDKAETQYFKTCYSSKEEQKSSSEKLVQEIVEEGIVLLKNDNNTLPLTFGSKITLLGQSSVDLVYGGGGAGSVDTTKAVDLLTALQKSGFNVNMTLWDFYKTGAGSKYRRTTPDVYGRGTFAVNEVPRSVYTEKEINSLKDYNDAAVVVLGRSGGESADLASTGKHFLKIDENEIELLKLAKENFKKVIVIINSSNAMELGFLKEYNIDAAISVGAIGQTGAYAIGEVLNGKVNPSGKLVDTYAYNALSAPAMANFGNYKITNSKVNKGNTYMVYGEGIYIGYYYYETRYEDVVLGNESVNNYDYTKQVQFPFGYGLSYSTFKWSDYSVVKKDDGYEVSVKVTNTGTATGKDVVQIYMQSPYTQYDKDNDIEKASVKLVGFAKTSKLEPGKSEVVKIKVDKEEMKVYDAKGYKTYIVDAGDYYFAAGLNAHDALNNILAAKGKTTANNMDYNGNADFVKKFTVDKLDAITYSVSAETGKKITNQFNDVDIKYYDPNFKYLSRRDWSGTWPITYAKGALTAPDKMLKDAEISFTEDSKAVMPVTGKIDEKYGKLSAAMFIGRDYNDKMWDALLNQLTVDEMAELVRMGGYATIPLPSINLPGTVDKDGPAGISTTLVGGGESGMAFPAEVTLASTWNIELANKLGVSIGEDSLSLGVHGVYAPGVNMHRAPFSGRNFEYFSEDSFLSGKMSASEVIGLQSKGAIVYMKHFALNDQETNRIGGLMFANEQTLREVYLKPFETTVREGNARGAMASMNRIGARWSGGHKGLMTETLRNEWGFKGMVITDQASFSVFAYEDLREGIEAGTNLWLNTDAKLWKLTNEQLTPTVVNNIRKSAKDIIYTIVNSNAMNGLAADSKIVEIIPKWQYWMIIFDVVAGLYIVVSTILVTRKLIKQKKELNSIGA
ncbi:glycoside hydrolase family 3 C-terminal domain-containing protein [Clostridium sp. SYSU_GA19001]|uniref:glycoside hydrolase family 3 protein n=1 Tax=Clostridium caldaquaticum TaxID=2940653 RepID=UPI002076DCC7|nr:glycoside hydrolase family 3 protein [Clostridium caldaquaticum]MCM8710752.1 glycoside hydrolase family 3 C-terminal domain-containing protein [Clostridium caldaquaticum]